ncbi:beta strand repeat-containing protein [Rugamonas apoptosis]|uniref:DUF4214 domain-containing protein n=1 Tax=Rugamonas apoptosis TaxID=2758570 RepID=A0A7W2FA91_9BURK|nr:DUF4214 domain-containing protein [Rugamonas apoptosis]MBA5687980.1 DUF4214 domain-containing protein [Rugamonas apoptosis]
MAAADYNDLVQQIYISYFGRPADVIGLKNVSAQLDALHAPTTLSGLLTASTTNAALSTLINSFGTSTESVALYGTDTLAFVDAVFVNVLNRHANFSGLLYWAGEIDAGRLSKAAAALNIALGAMNNTTEQGLIDAALLARKTTIATNFTNAIDTTDEILAYQGATAAVSARTMLSTVTSTTDTTAFQTTITTTLNTLLGGAAAAQAKTWDLTTAIDKVGGSSDDNFNAVIDDTTGAKKTTLNALDTINGGQGKDTLSLQVVNGAGPANTAVTDLPSSLSVTGVENALVRSAVNLTADVSGWTGLTSLKLTQGKAVTLTAAGTTAISVAGADGAISLNGGAAQTVSTAAANTNVTLGYTTVGKGAVSVSHSAQGSGNISIDGGTSVSLTTGEATTGTINIGQGGDATNQPSGAISVTTVGKAYAGTDMAVVRGAIQVTGGTTVTINETATSSAAAAAADTSLIGHTVVQSAVTVTAGAATTSVSVTETPEVSAVDAVPATVGVKQVDTVTFVAMAATESVTVGGLTFTATKALTAAQAAAAFANLSGGAVAGAAPAGSGSYTGVFSGSYGTGAVTATGTVVTVDATATNAVTGHTPITVYDMASAGDVAAVNKTAGLTNVDAKTGVLGVRSGAVTINGAIDGADKLASVTLDGIGAASSITSDALTSLNLAHSNEDVSVTNAAATTLALGLNGVGLANYTSTVTLGATYGTLNIDATGDDSFVKLYAGGVATLNISGSKAVDLSDSVLGKLSDVVVTGAAGVTMDASGTTVQTVNAAATVGANVISIDANQAVYTGGSGVDTVTLTTTAPTKAVSLGAGDDTLALASGTHSATAVLDGGAGTDTLAMASADAASASADGAFGAKITGFEHLKLGAVANAASDSVNLANLDGISYVTSAGGVGSGTLTLAHMANAGTLELTGAATSTTVTMSDATGTADSFNVIAKVTAADVAFNVVAVVGVETVNVSAIDTDVTSTGYGVQHAAIIITDAAAMTVHLDGNADLLLGLDPSDVALTLIDGSAMTGNLQAATVAGAAAAAVLKGGAGDDVLDALHNGDTVIGGAGADMLIAAADGVKLTGGAGNDLFVIQTPSTNVNNYVTITDATAGDMIGLATVGTVTFAETKVALDSTAIFQDYANAVVTGSNQGDIGWFQFGGNTYIVQHVYASTEVAFLNGTDLIVKLIGLVDLSHASLSADHAALLIG